MSVSNPSHIRVSVCTGTSESVVVATKSGVKFLELCIAISLVYLVFFILLLLSAGLWIQIYVTFPVEP
jgi:hypothetical protein